MGEEPKAKMNVTNISDRHLPQAISPCGPDKQKPQAGDGMSVSIQPSGRITERINRGIIRALRSQFSSSHEALCELIDNAINYKGVNGVDVRLEITTDRIVIENVGGRGMGRDEIQDFVTWGGGELHAADEISCYNQGGKAALAYLGDSYVLWSKRAGSPDWIRLDDPDIGTRIEPRDYGLLEPLDITEVPIHLRSVAMEDGAVRIELTKLDATRRIVPEALLRSLGDTYGKLLELGELRLSIDGLAAVPHQPVLDEEVDRAPIYLEEDGIVIRGWCGKLFRTPGGRQPKPGFRLYTKSRLIREGEWLGANAYAKGSLASFYGEIEAVGLTPNLSKTDINERGSHLWERICASVILQAQPVLSQLKGSGDPARVTDRDRRLARQVHKELEEALANLMGVEEETVVIEAVIQRRVITTGPGNVRVAGAPGGRSMGGPGRIVERDIVEQIATVIQRPTLPEIRIDSWDSSSRAETRFDEGRPVIFVNKNHPGFGASSAKFFIADSVILESLRSGQDSGWDIDGFCSRADECLASWARSNIPEGSTTE